ncbi:acyl-CoA dehydrogenase [Roseomonas sp. M0104]|uniref:Acyl-CoA dehydrogenase n=1 Tax=Teichococcus coralli TaxID=2545983 RepID=A0A845BDM4_9PROT|nr:acyl-CoA dehydrogenase family protein [Pseudoroseomonas coralli]MXP65221.1 acyl-CoA dehydrogenase [Pseudoroseomonas coralli]
MDGMMEQDEAERRESVRMIRESAAGLVPRHGDFARVRALRYADPGYDTAIWQAMGEQGWIGLRVPEAHGGIGLGMAEACALAEELGQALAPEPLVAGALSARLLAAAGDDSLLPALLQGRSLVLTAWQEAPDSLEAPGTPGAPRLFLPQAAGAETLLVPVAEGGALALYAVPAAGQALHLQRTQDGGNLGTLVPDLAGARRLHGDVGAALAVALEEAALVTAASLLGLMERAFAMTLDYLRTRQQFGKPLGSFQALQHRAADLRIQIALSRASVEGAARGLDAGAAPDRASAAVSRAKARAAEAAMLITREAVQMHGAIGYTDEHDIGLFLRKAMVLANAYGSAALHRNRFLEKADPLAA